MELEAEQANKALILSMQRVNELEETLRNGKQNNASHSDTLQRAINAEEEVAALRQQHLILKEFCEKEREQNELNQQRIEQLLKAAQTTEQATNLTPVQETEALHALKVENDALQQTLSENQQHNKQLERVIQFLREKAEESTLEAKQLNADFQVNQEAMSLLTHQYQTAREEVAQLYAQLNDQQTNQQDNNSQQKHVVSLLNAELTTLRQEKRQQDETLANLKAAHDEMELSTKIAQQHLAKKMKEGALLSEKIEEQKIQLLELQHALTEARSNISSIQQSMDLKLQHEIRLHDQLRETVKTLDMQNKKWEDKYFQIYDKWQDTEMQNKALRSIEDKHHQMQILISNLTAIVNSSPIHLPTSAPMTHISIDSRRMHSEHEEAYPGNKNPLFDTPQPTQRYKQTLFD